MLLMVEKKRDERCYAIYQYGEANNKYMKD